MDSENRAEPLLGGLWRELGGAAKSLISVSIEGPSELLPSVYPISDFAAGSVALATLAVAEWESIDRGTAPRRVFVDRAHAAIAFRSERYLQRPAKDWAPMWDSIAGDYSTRDGFIRLHTNYPHHRAATNRVLGAGLDREAVARRLTDWDAEALETAIVAEGGCAAAMHTPETWAASEAGRAIRAAPTIERVRTRGAGRRDRKSSLVDGRPLAGIRVLDLTRVIAGPTCTRVLAAWGADVLRIDPIGFREGNRLLADTTVGKRCAELDLRDEVGRARFEALLRDADILVHGYRSDALENLGYGEARYRRQNPALVCVSLDAYGFHGPWRTRRGFDSLVQMSCGIASRGQQVFGTQVPKPLPAQALDHGTGYLLAAAACRGLADAQQGIPELDFRLSLAGTAKALMEMGETGDPACTEPDEALVDRYRVDEDSVFGKLRRIACPGRIGESEPRWIRQAGRLGVDGPHWVDRALLA